MAVLLTNNVASTLASSLTTSSTSLTVAAGTGAKFPSPVAPDYFYATIISTTGEIEIVKVTSRANDVMTIVRAQDSTTAKTFPSKSRIEARINAKSVLDAVDDGVAEMTVVTNALDARLDIAEPEIDALQAAVISLDGRLDVAEPEIDALQAFDTTLGSSAGSNSVGFLQAGTGAVARTSQAKMRDVVSVFDFMTTAQIADVKAGTATIDVTVPVQAALDANVGAVYFPKGTYFINPITVPASTYIKTDGFDTVFKRNPASTNSVRTIRVSGSNVEIESFSFIGDIATGTFEWNHCIFIYADATTGAISNITIHDIYGQNIRGDIIEMGGLPAYPLKNVRVGRISGNNILRSGISVLGGENIEIQSVNVTNAGYYAFNIEPDPYNQPATGVRVGYVAGKAVGVVPSDPATFASSVEFGVLELHPTSYGTNSTPTYAPGGEQLTGFILRNVKDIRVGKLTATDYKSHAIFVVFNSGELGCQDLQIGLLNVANCSTTETTYNAYVWGGSVLQRLRIDAMIVDASATPTKAIIKECVSVILNNVSATLSNDTSLARACTRVVLDNAVISGGYVLLSISNGAVRNVSLNGQVLAAFCSPMTFENVVATASAYIFDSGNDNHHVINSTFNSSYFAAGFYKQSHTIALRFGNNWLWVDATGDLRIRNGTAPTSDTDGTVVGTQT